MNVIYEPRGAAAEYSPLAANLYRGCGHGCTYCYAPACLRMNAGEFHGHPAARPGVLAALAKDAEKLRAAGDRRPILLCFTCDPYQVPKSEEWYVKNQHITRDALTILGEAGLRIRILTKNGLGAAKDLDLFIKYDVEVGVSLVWNDDERRKEWEPNAGFVRGRIILLEMAARHNLHTWVSMEPVIDPAEALAALRDIAGKVGMVKIGKINHDAKLEAAVDWRKFTEEATAICQAAGQAYYIKNDLARAVAVAGSQEC